ncbi:MAG TPA: hypothetical protein VFS08_13945, partial [Gemmatimonadaceae bacterium]|nr:hypothetical protein [Gemmatimonadaceae bacterium]
MTVARPVAVVPGWASPRPSLDPVRMTAASAAPIRVLVASADAAIRDALTGVLADLGHELVDCVDCGADLARRAPMLRPDVVLLDASLLDAPAAPGAFSVQAVAESVPETAIVLVCDRPDVRLGDDDASVMAALAYLPRPVPPAVVDATVRLALARGREL